MKGLFSEEEFLKAKNCDFLKLECILCSKAFYQYSGEIKRVLSGKSKSALNFCSRKCYLNGRNYKNICMCKNCDKPIEKTLREIKRGRVKFCSKSCAATYNNKHKTHGNRRSKLEIWIEEELIKNYPNLEIHFNKKNAINSELDIYFPDLKLAFEINGIHHYEPIFSAEKLEKIKNNDNEKSLKCKINNISLYTINTSSQKVFKESSSHQFLIFIKEIVDNK